MRTRPSSKGTKRASGGRCAGAGHCGLYRDEPGGRCAARRAGHGEIVRTSGAPPRVLLADAGYCSDANVTALQAMGSEPLIATRQQRHGERLPDAPRGRPPAGLTVRERMQRRLPTQRGRRLYARRKAIVEPVFGLIKRARGFRQFLLRGLAKVHAEWTLICLTQNLLTLYRSGRRILA